MRPSRYATSRQKACLHCSTAKAKCDRKVGRCTRCAQKGLSCNYPQPTQSGSSTLDGAGLNGSIPTSSVLSTPRPFLPSPERELSVGANLPRSIIESPGATISASLASPPSISSESQNVALNSSSTSAGSDSPDFSGLDLFASLELFCPINANDISNRWLNSYVPIPGQRIKEYPASVSSYIYRILNSYAAVTVRGRGVPPFVHASQMTATARRPPLSTCLTLVRMCEQPLPGSENVATDVLQREMNSIYEQHGRFDDMALLAAFQAYLIYSMVLFFRLGQGPNPFLRQAMTNLQELACASTRRGLMCAAEQQRFRPRWESWIVAEAKRRTLFTMYLFDSVLSSQDGLPTFLGTELLGLPAPGNRFLWIARTRHEWEMAYNVHLADWTEGGLRIDELWPIPADLGEAGLVERRRRVDLWLENVDEFGTALYAVTSCTHGG